MKYFYTLIVFFTYLCSSCTKESDGTIDALSIVDPIDVNMERSAIVSRLQNARTTQEMVNIFDTHRDFLYRDLAMRLICMGHKTAPSRIDTYYGSGEVVDLVSSSGEYMSGYFHRELFYKIIWEDTGEVVYIFMLHYNPAKYIDTSESYLLTKCQIREKPITTMGFVCSAISCSVCCLRSMRRRL